jgi:DNA-binding CsgD family transcriptional regulator
MSTPQDTAQPVSAHETVPESTAAPTTEPRSYRRFGRLDRVQHILMLVSFLVLTATGLPQKFIYANVPALDALIDLMGGIEAIRLVHRGEAALAGSAAARVLDLLRRGEGGVVASDLLTPRERDILALVALGDDNRSVALKLSLSEKTVGNRLSEIFQKLGVSNRTQAAIVAVQRGLVPPPESR